MRILISGDSWGCGEWGVDIDNKYKVMHKGIEHYLLNDGHIVENISVPGSSIADAIQNLKKNNISEYDFAIFFQTDPLRNLRPYHKIYEKFLSFNDVIKIQDEILDYSYNLLDNIGIKIYFFGGCSKIKINNIKNYNNLIPVLPAITEFLFPEYTHPLVWTSDILHRNDILKNLNLDVLTGFFEQKRKQDMLFNKEYAHYFGTDGRHPNRLGHYRIYEYFKDNILNQL